MTSDARTVLVVDDGRRGGPSVLLEGEGFGAAGARDGREALACLRAPPPPRVVALDLMMPAMNGREFRAERLRDRLSAGVPAVVLTAAPDGRRRAEAPRATDDRATPLRFEPFFDAPRANGC